MPRLHVLVATARPGRLGSQLAEWFVGRAKEHRWFDVEVIDVAAADLPYLDEPGYPAEQQTGGSVPAWSATVAAADAFVFILPEHNRGFAATFKNALDHLYYEWHYKPVGFVSYGGPTAGLLAVQLLQPVLTTLKMMPVADVVSVPLPDRVDDAGRLQPTEAMANSAAAMLDELQLLTEAFLTIRAAD